MALQCLQYLNFKYNMPEILPSPRADNYFTKPKSAATVVDKGLSHSTLPHRGGMTGQSAPTVLVCWSL